MNAQQLVPILNRKLQEMEGQYNRAVADIIQFRAILKASAELISMAKCPDCDGSGSYFSEDEEQQCRWCFESNQILTVVGIVNEVKHGVSGHKEVEPESNIQLQP